MKRLKTNERVLFHDRAYAGKRIGEFLKKLSYLDPVILGIPLGGVVLAHEVAGSMDAPMDVILTRKITHPRYPELGIGAISEDGSSTTVMGEVFFR